MANTRKRMLSLVLSLVMALSLLPATALAADYKGAGHTQIEYNWTTQGWDNVSSDTVGGQAFNAISGSLRPVMVEVSGGACTMTAPTLLKEGALISTYNENTGRYEISDGTYTWYWIGCRAARSGAFIPAQEILNGTTLSGTASVRQYCWVRTDRDNAEANRPEIGTVYYDLKGTQEFPEGTQFYGASGDYGETELIRNPNRIEEKGTDITETVGTPYSCDQARGYTFIASGTSGLLSKKTGFSNFYAIHISDDQTKTFWRIKGWIYNGEEYSNSGYDRLLMPQENITFTAVWEQFYSLDLTASQRTTVQIFASSNAEYEILYSNRDKISYAWKPTDGHELEKQDGGWVIKDLDKGSNIIAPIPWTTDMKEEDDPQEPYLCAYDEEGNLLAKWICTSGFFYTGGVRTDFKLGEEITVPGDPTDYLDNKVYLYYNWELEGYTVSYDLNRGEAEGCLPESAVVLKGEMEDGIMTVDFYNDGDKMTQQKLDTATMLKPDGATFVTSPKFNDAPSPQDMIAWVDGADGSRTYYEFLGWKLKGDPSGHVYKLSDTATVDGSDMKLMAAWREVAPAELVVTDGPQVELSVLDARIEQHSSANTTWTANSESAPLVVEKDGKVFYRATLTMNSATAMLLENQNIPSEDFANFDIRVKIDENLQMVEEDTVTFSFTCTFLKPTGDVVLADGSPAESVTMTENGNTYTFTVLKAELADEEGGFQEFSIPVKWKPGRYAQNVLQQKISLEVMCGQIPEGYGETVATTGVITGAIDPSECDRMERNLSSLAALYIYMYPEWREAFNGCQTMLDIIKATKYLGEVAYGNIVIPANTVYAKLPSYTVTVNYLDEAGNTIHEPYVTDAMVAGSAYDVTSQDKIAIDNYIYTRTEGSLTGTLDEDKVVNVYYTRGEGALAISKTVNGVDTDRQFTFIITLMDGETPLTGTYAYTGSKEGSITLDENGSAQIQLSNGQHIAINKIPAGVRYVVTETPVEDFSTQVTGHDATAAGNVDNGSIVSGASATVTYINTYDPEPVPQYTITVNYRDVNTAQALINSVIVTLNEGDPYDVSGLIYGSIGQYAYVRTTGGPVAGTITANIEITAWYQSTYVPPYIPPVNPVDPPIDIDDENVPLADLPGLNTVDHYAYIAGYPDGTVRPNGNITRAEVATIFFRLFTDEYRQTYWATSNPFSDVAFTAWYNNGVSTAANAGIVAGYPDGTFLPDNNITRAEFATIAARFLSEAYAGPDLFTDISGHWAQEYINRAANAGWINGYPDGTFHPDAYITRAEAVTLVNNMLGRMPHEDHLLANMKVWPDNPETAWYYEAVQEATNSHDYDWATEEEVRLYEIWTELLPERDWAALEKEWSNAYSSTGADVIDNMNTGR